MFENFMMIPGRDDDKKLGRESLLKRSIDGRWVRGGADRRGSAVMVDARWIVGRNDDVWDLWYGTTVRTQPLWT